MHQPRLNSIPMQIPSTSRHQPLPPKTPCPQSPLSNKLLRPNAGIPANIAVTAVTVVIRLLPLTLPLRHPPLARVVAAAALLALRVLAPVLQSFHPALAILLLPTHLFNPRPASNPPTSYTKTQGHRFFNKAKPPSCLRNQFFARPLPRRHPRM